MTEEEYAARRLENQTLRDILQNFEKGETGTAPLTQALRVLIHRELERERNTPRLVVSKGFSDARKTEQGETI
jgi:hypothetical protein